MQTSGGLFLVRESNARQPIRRSCDRLVASCFHGYFASNDKCVFEIIYKHQKKVGRVGSTFVNRDQKRISRWAESGQVVGRSGQKWAEVGRAAHLPAHFRYYVTTDSIYV